MSHENAFGQQVRQRRRSLDLTQEELARRVGCAAITLRKIEAGDLRPSQQIAERLAMALAIPLDERAEFVRQARSVQLPGRPIEPAPIPQVMPEEIGLEDLSGRAIRGYQLNEKIGAGSFGAVYRGAAIPVLSLVTHPWYFPCALSSVWQSPTNAIHTTRPRQTVVFLARHALHRLARRNAKRVTPAVPLVFVVSAPVIFARCLPRLTLASRAEPWRGSHRQWLGALPSST